MLGQSKPKAEPLIGASEFSVCGAAKRKSPMEDCAKGIPRYSVTFVALGEGRPVIKSDVVCTAAPAGVPRMRLGRRSRSPRVQSDWQRCILRVLGRVNLQKLCCVQDPKRWARKWNGKTTAIIFLRCHKKIPLNLRKT